MGIYFEIYDLLFFKDCQLAVFRLYNWNDAFCVYWIVYVGRVKSDGCNLNLFAINKTNIAHTKKHFVFMDNNYS